MSNTQNTLDEIKTKIEDIKNEIVSLKNTMYCNSSKLERCDLVTMPDNILLTHEDSENIFKFENIADLIFKNKHDINEDLKLSTSGLKAFDNNEFRIDEKHELKEIATKFIYKNVLNNNGIYIVLETIQKMWDASISRYIDLFNLENTHQINKNDIKLLYRGGNTLSSILQEILKSTPPLLLKQITETFENVMAKSDIDFTILLNPHKFDTSDDIYKEIFNDVSFLTLGIIYRLRFMILAQQLPIFKDVTNLHLKNLLNMLNLMDCVKDMPENTSPYKNFKFVRVVFGSSYFESQNLDDVPLNYEINKYNFGVFNNDPGSSHNNIQILTYKQDSVIQNLQSTFFGSYSNTPSYFYVTYNNDNRYKSTQLLQRYSLARLKINFKAFYMYEDKLNVIHLPGEFLDLGLTNNDVSDESEIVTANTQKDLIEKWDNIKQYTFSRKQKLETAIYSFTLKYYFVDICNMLFLIAKYPWENKKYLKLLKRAFLLCQIDLLSRTKEDGIIMPNNISIIMFMKTLKDHTDIDKKLQYISLIDNTLYYFKFFQHIKQLSDSFSQNDDQQLIIKFNSDVNELFELNNGIISSVFLRHSRDNFIIDTSQSKIII